ncbi:MAG: thiolase domain-containing protein [Chloroflexi bacterium]|nr:thiolase domain-containing protein [Chloroflexota bacterium]
MRNVSVVGIAQIPVEKASTRSLRQLGAEVTIAAMADAGVEKVDALYASNMLSDELQGQKHIAALIADEAGLTEIEALQVRAATASGAAALRVGHLAVGSGEADLAVVVGVEIMSQGVASPALSKALDAEREVADGATLISTNAELMRLYFDRYQVPDDGLVNFSLNAHRNARHNPNALYRDRTISARAVKNSRIIHAPLRLLDSSPICDGAAALVLAPTEEARAYNPQPVHILASSVSTDRFRIEDRQDPLWLEAAHSSSQKAFRQANVNIDEVSFFEVHDAFSIMSCLLMEAVGFAEPGQGWRLAEDKKITLKGEIPISTMGGLKARGHPIGATALYQACEIVIQLTHRAGKIQVRNPSVGMMQSVGAAATTVITHIFSA